MTLEVTRAGPDDMAALLPMVTALAAHHGDDCTADLETIARDLTGPAACGTALIGRRAGTAEGYAVLFPILEIQAGRRGMVLHHLFVDANARGLGLGKALIAACVVHARRAGSATLSVGTVHGNDAAGQVYLSQGFEPVSPPGPRFKMRL